MGTRVADRLRRVRQSQVMLEFVRASSTGLEHVLEHGTSHRGHGCLVLALYILLYEHCPQAGLTPLSVLLYSWWNKVTPELQLVTSFTTRSAETPRHACMGATLQQA